MYRTVSARPETPPSHSEGTSGEPSGSGGTASVNRERGSVCAQNRPVGTSRRIGKALTRVGPYVGQLFRPYKERPSAPPHSLHTRSAAFRSEPSSSRVAREPRVPETQASWTLTVAVPAASLAATSPTGTARSGASLWGRLGVPSSSSASSVSAPETSSGGQSGTAAVPSRWHWAREAVLIVAAVVLLAEGLTIALIYTMSFLDGYAITVTTNSIGEFWFEFPVVLASVPLGLFALYATIDRLKVRLDERVARPHGTSVRSRDVVDGLGYGDGVPRAYPGYLAARADVAGRERELPPPAFGRAG